MMRAIQTQSSLASVRSGWAGIERGELDRLGGLALELGGQDLAAADLDQDAVAAPDRGIRRHDEDGRVPIHRPHRVAGNFQRIGVSVLDGRKSGLVPAVAVGKAARVEIAGVGRPGRSRSSARSAPARATAPIRATNWSTVVLVAARHFATDSVDGQRCRWSGVTRLDLLKVVGSSPARLASPDGEVPARAASASMASQIWVWVEHGGWRGRRHGGTWVRRARRTAVGAGADRTDRRLGIIT